MFNVNGQNNKILRKYEQQRDQKEILASLESGAYVYEFFEDGFFIKYNVDQKGGGMFYIKNDSIIFSFNKDFKKSRYILLNKKK